MGAKTEQVLLVIEDDATQRDLYRFSLESVGYRVITAADGSEGLQAIEQHEVALVLCDECMTPMSGHEFLEQTRDHARPCIRTIPVLMISGYADVSHAVAAMRIGAVDYLTKPVTTTELIKAVESHIPLPRLADGDHGGMVAVAQSSRDLVELAGRAAQTDATVLVTGPSGAGKEVMARYIHRSSKRADAPFVAINCAAIPASMLEATLFGFEKGAFTNAQQSTPGKFEQAQGGTLLLDEISEMSLELQAKLLRVLQEREVERLGSRKVIKLDLRIIATSNRDLPRAVQQGAFREDLYFRLSVFPIRLTPLMERRDDIVPIAETLLQKYGESAGRLTSAAAEKLLQHNWPGNVRELENLIQRGLILANQRPIAPEHLQFDPDMGCLGDSVQHPHHSVPEADQQPMSDSGDNSERLRSSLRQQEQQQLLDALRTFKTRKAAASHLGISERTLRYKLARLRDQGVVLPTSRGAI